MDVIKWARETAEAKGTKFTPLSKDDQLAIAEFIVSASEASADPGRNPMDDMEGVPTDAPAEAAAAPIPGMESFPAEREHTEGKDETETKAEPQYEEKDEKYVHVRRADRLRKCGMDAQSAYDEFLTWASENPRESFVMDFATGEKNAGAAFAYWLNEMVVEVAE